MEKSKKLAGNQKKTTKKSKIDSSINSPKSSFPIAGIGASAGGLEALDLFLTHVPKNCGIAFVIVQHLDPKHKGIMPELLQRSTKMKVFQVQDRMKVEPDCVYVIPPNKDMSILHGALHLFEPAPEINPFRHFENFNQLESAKYGREKRQEKPGQ